MPRLEPSPSLRLSFLLSALLGVSAIGCVDEFDEFDEQAWRNYEDSLGPLPDDPSFDDSYKCPVLDEPTTEHSDPESGSPTAIQKLGHPSTSTPTIPPVIDDYKDDADEPDCWTDAPAPDGGEAPPSADDPMLDAPADPSCDPAISPGC